MIQSKKIKKSYCIIPIGVICVPVFVMLFACGGKKEELTVRTENISGTVLKSSFKVWGNCDMCKETIEGSLQKDGITSANWNSETKIIAVEYDSTKINLDAVEKSIAFAGYDNVKYKGDDKAYAELPECCKYDRK
jgi:mercuric ion binding protein